MAPNYDSLVNIPDNKSKWCSFARIFRLWSTIDSNSSEKSTTIHMILMDNYVSFLYFILDLNALLAPYVCLGSNFSPLLKKTTFQPLTSAPFATHRPPLILTWSKATV